MPTPEINPQILIVEDERGMREGIFRILTLRGLQAFKAASGEEALKMIETGNYPLMLVDLKMPGMDGFELLERVNRLRPGTIYVVVSAFATVESIVKTTKMGTFDFVVKPFIPDDLMAVVNRAIEKWRSTKETERLRAEREAHLLQLAAEKSRLKTIMQSIGDGLLVVNIENNVVLDNAAARSLLRRIDEPCQCVPVREVIPNSEVCDEIRNLLLDPKAHQIKLEMELPPRNEQETPVHLRLTLAPFRDEIDKVLGIMVLLSDITETKAYERMKTMFISMVAHEIKAPIAAIESYLNLIEAGALNSDMKQIQEVASRCLERSGSLLALVKDLLEITRQETIQRYRIIEKVDVNELVSKLVEFHRSQANDRHITIELTASPISRCLLADAGDIERILTNLLSNAIKYNQEGGKVWIRLDFTATVLKIEVEDTGIGLKQEEIQRIGEEFFRVKNEKTRAITGTGLGLALVNRIVKSYNGALEVESFPEKGSIFRVLLPFEGSNNGKGN
ncbi:MAG: response regulator [Candidatus Riflebacteria bacterium]|nr:response regulator [Candidatus Riflebacteria bacterium]